jgi:hypothetical protein
MVCEMEFPSFKKNGRFEPMTFWLFFSSHQGSFSPAEFMANLKQTAKKHGL